MSEQKERRIDTLSRFGSCLSAGEIDPIALGALFGVALCGLLALLAGSP